MAKTKGHWVGKWKNRANKPFNIDWQNEKIEGLGIWLGNKGVEDLTFGTQLLKIKAKLKFWKPVKLSLMYQSVPSVTIPSPGNFLMGEFPTPGAKRSSKPPLPEPIKTS